MDYPIITTDRLRLRGWTDTDIDAFARLNANSEFMTFLGNRTPIDRAESYRVMMMVVGHWALKGFGLWLVEDRYSHEFIGRVGLLYPDGWPALEVGWGIHPEHQGMGYATEAATASADWAFQNLNCESLVSIIDPNNTPSKAVAERIGEHYDHNEFVKDRDCEIFKMTKTIPVRSTRPGPFLL